MCGLIFEGSQGTATAVDMLDAVDWHSTLHVLAEVTTRLKKMVQDLKNLYVSCRTADYSLRLGLHYLD